MAVLRALEISGSIKLLISPGVVSEVGKQRFANGEKVAVLSWVNMKDSQNWRTASSEFGTVSLAIENPTICIAETQSKKEGKRPQAKAKKPRPADNERTAAGKLKLAKSLMTVNPAAAQRRLTEIIEEYPQTEAAKEAKELLGQSDE